MKLIHKATGKAVNVGDVVTDFRGNKARVVSFSKPHKPSSSGKVTVEEAPGVTSEYYVTVYDLEWIDREDR